MYSTNCSSGKASVIREMSVLVCMYAPTKGDKGSELGAGRELGESPKWNNETFEKMLKWEAWHE